MSLLSPLALLGLLGIAGALIAHRLGKAAPKRVSFAGMRFLQREQPAVARRRQFSEIPLMLIRIALLAAAVIAIAKPTSEGEPELAVLGVAHDAVLVVDTSPSMELRVDGQSHARRVLAQARQVIDALAPGSRASLWLSHQPDRVRVAMSEDTAEIAETLERLGTQTFARRTRSPIDGAWLRTGDLAATVKSAADQTAPRPRPPGEADDEGSTGTVIYVLSDRSAGGLASVGLAPGSAADQQLIALPVDRSLTPDDREPVHIGIRSARAEPAPSLGDRAVQIKVRLRRYGDASAIERNAEQVEIGLDVAGERVSSTRANFSAGADEVEVEFVHILRKQVEAAPATLVLERPDDALPVDDRYHLWLTPNARLDLVFVNGDPSEQRTHDELYFLSTAIRSSDMKDRVRIRGWAPSQLEERLAGDELGDVDVVVLANVRALEPSAAQALIRSVDAGVGLWISTGGRVSAEAYNKTLAPILPLALRQAVVAGTAPGRARARGMGMASALLAHPMFASLERGLDLSNTRTTRMFLLEPDPGRKRAIALEFDNGAPALLTREHGRGRVALLTTTIDRDWTDLPLRPGFVELARSTLRWLAGDDSDHRLADLRVGEPTTLAFDAPVLVHDPDSRLVPFDATRDGQRFDETLAAGHYRVTAVRNGASDGLGHALTHFVTNVDRNESDTRVLAVPGTTPTAEGSLAHGQHVPQWRLFAWLVLAFMTLESALRLRPHLRRLRAH